MFRVCLSDQFTRVSLSCVFEMGQGMLDDYQIITFTG